MIAESGAEWGPEGGWVVASLSHLGSHVSSGYSMYIEAYKLDARYIGIFTIYTK